MNTKLRLLEVIVYCIRGLIFHLFICLVAVLNLPVYLYRLLIAKAIAPLFSYKVSKIVDSASQQFAVDFRKPILPSRNTVVFTSVFEGNISFADFCQAVDANCIKARDASGNLLYPELQQYVESWMGFMFWKHDKDFSLKNHLFLHQSNNNSPSDNWINDFVEIKLNEPFPLKQSPWELHLIQNAKLDYLSHKTQAREQSIVVFKVHHAMADGFSIQQLLIENLYGNPLQNLKPAKASSLPRSTFFQNLSFPLRYLYRLGWVASRISRQPKGLLVSDKETSGHLTFAKGKLISLQTVKFIKNRLNVSFAAVINSAASAALSKFCREQELASNNFGNAMLIGNVVPRPNHPKGLRNHANGLSLEVPLTVAPSHLERLQFCQETLMLASSAPLTFMAKLFVAVFLAQLAPVVKLTIKNNYIAAGLSNFAGPGSHYYWNGTNKAMDTYAICGPFTGKSSMLISATGYVDTFRFSVAIEKSLCTSDGANMLLNYAYEEIEELYKIALSMSSGK